MRCAGGSRPGWIGGSYTIRPHGTGTRPHHAIVAHVRRRLQACLTAGAPGGVARRVSDPRDPERSCLPSQTPSWRGRAFVESAGTVVSVGVVKPHRGATYLRTQANGVWTDNRRWGGCRTTCRQR
ncbi:DUF3892 domain-containing protein [Xylanimonas cellulosilytica]|uniref:DUF3892 domain-containing protein n=1 Tax=Xylanimonas cellulosilytica TaxID=186189 RepID=UPI0009D646BB